MFRSSYNKTILYILLIAPIGILKEDQIPFKHSISGIFEEIIPSISERQDESFLEYKETFEKGKPFANQSMQFADEHSFNVVADPDLSHNKVGRFELRDTDPQVKRSIRAEVSFRTAQKEAWYAYSIYFPLEDYEKDSMPEIISQWHQAGGGSPPNAVQIQNDQIFFRSINRSDTRDNSNKVYTNYPLDKVKRGEWQKYIFHFIHSPNGDGLIEIWHNQIKIYTITGPNMREEFDLPNFKFGIYKWRWSNGEKTQTDLRALFFDNVRIGNKNATLNSIIATDK